MFALRSRIQEIPLLRGPSLVRSVFVASKSRTKRRDTKPKASAAEDDKLRKWAIDDTLRSHQLNEEDYKRKLKEIRRLTSSVSKLIQKKEDEKKQVQLVKDIPLPSEVELDKEVDSLYEALESPRSVDVQKASLLTPVVDLPQAIHDRLGLSVKYLVNQHNQNWPLVLHTLSLGGGFQGLSKVDVASFIQNIPKKDLEPIIPQIQQLMKSASMVVTPSMWTAFIQAWSSHSHIPEENVKSIEYARKRIHKITKGKLPMSAFESLVVAYGKMGDLDKVNEVLVELKSLGLKPTPLIYKNVLKTLVYRSSNHKEAVSVFDSMKFLSQETKPRTTVYKDIIVSYVNADNIEKALDLYQEMLSSKTPVNQEIMVALAKGCSSRKELRFKAWEFMFEIYDNRWSPSIETLEYMIYLASKDGDLALARAFYKMLLSTNSVSKRSFTFLLMAYSKSNTFKDPPELPSITMTERGRNFRRNMLNRVDPPLSEDMKLNVPFLPLYDLNTAEKVIAESKALWSHTLMYNKEFVNIESYNTYLNIAATLGSFEDLKEAYDFSSLIADAPGVRIVEEEEQSQLSEFKSKVNIERSSLTYVIALKGAGRLKKYEFSQEIWMERGKYRQSPTFKALNIKEKDRLDFQFANQMVQSLTSMNLLDDALAIVLSTEYQFKWGWLQLQPLYNKCVDVGNEKHCRTIRGIAGRAQIKFEGKIRKKDFKEYVMKKRLWNS